jgi:hypothetical protein
LRHPPQHQAQSIPRSSAGFARCFNQVPLAGTARTAASATSFRLRNKKQDRCQRGRVCPLRFNSFSRSVILIDGGDGEQSQHEPMAPVFKLPLLLKELSGQFYCGGRDA